MISRSRIAGLVLAVSCMCVTAPIRAYAQNATFAGTVLIDPSEKPLANAEIIFTALNRSVRSDSAGNFVFTALPAGKHSVTVRMLGYESLTTDITVGTSGKVEADLMLKASTQQLATVSVIDVAAGPYASRLVEFDARRKSGAGRFITGDVFTKADGRPMSAIITQRMSGVKMMQVNGQKYLVNSRPGERRLGGGGSGGACYTQVVVNGIIRYNGSQPLFDIDQLDAKDVIGFEYHNAATTPTQYNATMGSGGASCGTVIIWTKGG